MTNFFLSLQFKKYSEQERCMLLLKLLCRGKLHEGKSVSRLETRRFFIFEKSLWKLGSLEHGPWSNKKGQKNSEQFQKYIPTEDTERIWLETPKKAQRWRQASGGTTSRLRYILRDSLDAIRRKKDVPIPVPK
jgi:hypothetical protein